MKIVFLIIFIGVLFSVQAQSVDNIRLSVEGDKVIVLYDLYGNPKASYNIKIIFRSTTDINPYAVSGDVGDNVTVGRDKKIVWDVYQDLDGLQGNLQAIVSINATDLTYLSGPKAAWLSALVPGWGSYKVTEKKTYSIVAASYYLGSIIYEYGVVVPKQNSIEQDFNKGNLSQSEYDSQWNKTVSQRTVLPLSRVLLKVADISYTIHKGKRNVQYGMTNQASLKIEPTFFQTSNGQITPGLGLTFNLGK